MQASNTAHRPRAALIVVAVVVILGALGLAGWLLYTQGKVAGRQAAVAERGSTVMPFDLEQTTHIFDDLPDGGLQQVIADDPADTTQITLIQGHLQAEAAKFQDGDFSDPAAIHGDSMPGLAELQRGYAQIDVVYTELPNGGQIRYITSDPVMVAAVHAWFAAQLHDHGRHATDHGGH